MRGKDHILVVRISLHARNCKKSSLLSGGGPIQLAKVEAAVATFPKDTPNFAFGGGVFGMADGAAAAAAVKATVEEAAASPGCGAKVTPLLFFLAGSCGSSVATAGSFCSSPVAVSLVAAAGRFKAAWCKSALDQQTGPLCQTMPDHIPLHPCDEHGIVASMQEYGRESFD